MASPVACVGDTFEGYCSVRGHGSVTGTIISGNDLISLEGKAVAVSGCVAEATCGCTGTVHGMSTLLSLDGNAVARVGDPIDLNTAIDEKTGKVVVVGTLSGTITSGSDLLAID